MVSISSRMASFLLLEPPDCERKGFNVIDAQWFAILPLRELPFGVKKQ
jgi:hypothetical protein